MAETIDRARFERRLLELLRARSGWPRRPVDRQILLKSAILALGPARELDETAVNEAIMRWQVATGVGLDYVTWRRYLVDAGYLTRDRARTVYAPATPPEELSGVRFSPDVHEVDVPALLRQDRDAIAKRKDEHRKT